MEKGETRNSKPKSKWEEYQNNSDESWDKYE